MASLKETLKTYSDSVSGNSVKELEVAIAQDLIANIPSESLPSGLTSGRLARMSRRKLEKTLFFSDVTEKVDNRVSHIARKLDAFKSDKEAYAVQAIIDALPEAASIAAGDEDAIVAARAAYDALTSAQKAKVDATKLTAAEEALAAL